MNSDTEDEPQPKPVVVAPKVTAVRRPRNILRPEHLISKKGIPMLPSLLTKETKFKGKGHELADLKLLLFKTKHWAHRLFPAATFEDFIEKSEQLGQKRPVKNCLGKIRQNLPLNFDDDLVHVVNSDGEDDDNSSNNNKLQKLLNDTDSTKKSGLDYSSASVKPVFDFDQLFKDHIEDMKKKDQAEEAAIQAVQQQNDDQQLRDREELNSHESNIKHHTANSNNNFNINELDALVDDADFDDLY